MKVAYFVIAVCCSLSIACGGPSVSNGPHTSAAQPGVNRAEAVVAEHLKRENVPYRKDRIRFTVREEGEPVKVVELDAWRRHAGGTTTTLSVIVKPVEDAGLGTMAIEEPAKPTVVVSYAASRDEFRETDTGKIFFGGLTAQELLGEWDKYTYKLVGDNGGTEVEGKLKDGERSVIDSTKVIFNSETYLPVEMHLFDNTGKKLRAYKSSEPRTVSGHTYFARTEAVNHVYRSEITIEILSREYPEKLDDALFTREKLKASAMNGN